ncbi:hypothetical protein LCGC14_2070480 [marine sediment metagenome]|uniref:Uncharacterized protein n=1 Tax=marine sediment metagenome TaxID=412755 RepID=A0A0F9GWZ4_9ZZZZ
MGLEGWPLAVVLMFAMFATWAVFDSWYKQPFIRKQVGDMTITARGHKAVDHVISKYKDDKAHDVHHEGPIQ